MVAVFIRLHGQGEYPVALHHFFIAVTLHAYNGMESRVLGGLLVSQRFDFMETMAVIAGRRILIAGASCIQHPAPQRSDED